MRSGATVPRRRLARQLRELRESASMTLEEAAPELDWSPSKLSRIENAHQAVDVHAVRSMLDLYDVGGDRWGELIALTREAAQRGWWRQYGLSDQCYVPLEAAAGSVRDFTVTYVPGLLQTADYARALFAASVTPHSPDAVEREVEVRMIRQERLTSATDPLELAAIVDEAVLHRPVGGPAVMRAQLRYLIDAAGLDTVTFQVVPSGVGAHAAMGGAFTVLNFDGLGEPDMAYVEHSMGAVHIEKAQDVARARLVFDRVRSVALSPAESVALVERVAAEM
ncbi:helix-turn-helix domain-containing protein [Pseudonocardia nigra]|uniref:helix-turn-helix domain-containing protein n=1 Tax=Pseudonocardia nigra TaxID=1921578 RepID=UPI0027E2D600|nr:helix-turn-helix transcriptional regulator [Pseudonocardia nigra]